MSASYVRERYGVPATRGTRIVADGSPGTIVGFRGGYLRVRLDESSRVSTWHPTWRIEWPTQETDPE